MVKMRYFPYIKQNSIAEIVSTMESFLKSGRPSSKGAESNNVFFAFDFDVIDISLYEIYI